MKLIGISALMLFWMAFTEAHPLHLSITNITYENGKLKISMKTFRDDWEVAYFHFHSKPIDFKNPSNRKIPWVEDYLNRKFKISYKEGIPGLEFMIDTIQVDGDALTIEMHSTISSKPNSLYIYNALLTDIFPDQTNLVIFGFNKKETGIKFDMRKHDAQVLLK